MLSKIISCALTGIDGYQVDVEVDVTNGLPGFDMVGLPDSAVKESKERVRTAVKNAGFPFPVKRITVNLAPANIRKEGPAFDLPIAVGILVCTGVIPPEAVQGIFLVGELSLDGTIRKVNGILPMANSIFQNGIDSCMVPYENAEEAALVSSMQVFPVRHLKEVVAHFTGKNQVKRYFSGDSGTFADAEKEISVDMADVKGQEIAKRAMEIAAAGYHNILMVGPPGSGKTMLARRLPSIMPDLTFDESMEITKIYSVSGLLKDKNALIKKRPFRAPHHTISASALTGGGRVPKPGEISLSHKGVLFLDELPEFARNVLEVMRQPLEEGFVTVSRVNGTVTYPADFMLVAAMNPCPCGYLGESDRCHCTQNEILKYTGKISGPLLDRIEIMVEVASVKYQDLENKSVGETSFDIKKRIMQAHTIQLERFKKEGIQFNSQMNVSQIEKYCHLGIKEKELLKAAFDRLHLSARGYHKILKVARTVADLEGKETIHAKHIGEVIHYRSLDRKYML